MTNYLNYNNLRTLYIIIIISYKMKSLRKISRTPNPEAGSLAKENMQNSLDNSYTDELSSRKISFRNPTRGFNNLRRRLVSIDHNGPVKSRYSNIQQKHNRSMSLVAGEILQKDGLNVRGNLRQSCIENLALSEELLNLKRDQQKVCSYINSYNIDNELGKLKLDKLDNYEQTARSITTLVRLHLKRLNVKVYDKRDLGLMDLMEIRRQKNIHSSISNIDDLKKEISFIHNEARLLKPAKLQKSETLIPTQNRLKLFRRKHKKIQIGQIQRLNKSKVMRENKDFEKGWWGSFKKGCLNQISLNKNITTMYFL